MAFSDHRAELLAHFDQMPPLLTSKYIARAWTDICESRLWSFLVGHGVLISPAIITTGTAAVTRFSNQVTLNSAAAAVWDALSSSELLYAPIEKRQFRSGSTSGELYTVSDYVSPTVYLDRVFTSETAAAANYQLFRAFYEPPFPALAYGIGTATPAASSTPEPEFLRFESVVDSESGYPLRLGFKQTDLNQGDPQRSSQGQPYRVVDYKADVNGKPLYELWPHPTAARAYPTVYIKKQTAYAADADTLPASFPEDVVLERAMWYASMWAQKQVGRFPGYRPVNWSFIAAEHRNNHMRELAKAKTRDEETFNQMITMSPLMRGRMSPIDAKFAQSHDVDWM
jgi:hypothetical protein